MIIRANTYVNGEQLLNITYGLVSILSMSILSNRMRSLIHLIIDYYYLKIVVNITFYIESVEYTMLLENIRQTS